MEHVSFTQDFYKDHAQNKNSKIWCNILKLYFAHTRYRRGFVQTHIFNFVY